MRFQGGTVFPMTMAIVILLGLGLVVYARQSAPSANTPPTVNDHWHVSYGFYACDQQLKDLAGTKEDPVDPLFVKYGIHSHNDGVIHWHPQALATGRRAKLGLFLETYGVKVDPIQITLTCGASPALVMALSATFRPGDVIAMRFAHKQNTQFFPVREATQPEKWV